MAGSGDFTRVGNTRALNAELMSSGALGGVGGCDLIGVVTTTVATNTSTTSFALSGGLTKAIPDEAIVVTIPAAGTIAGVQAWCVNGAAASGATTLTVDAQTTRTVGGAVTNGDSMYMLSFVPYLVLMTSAVVPLNNTLGTEYVQTGNARQAIVWTTPTAADPPVAANNGAITFGPISGATGSVIISYCTLMDSPTTSTGTIANATAFWTFGTTRTPNAGDSLQIASAALTMQCT